MKKARFLSCAAFSLVAASQRAADATREKAAQQFWRGNNGFFCPLCDLVGFLSFPTSIMTSRIVPKSPINHRLGSGGQPFENTILLFRIAQWKKDRSFRFNFLDTSLGSRAWGNFRKSRRQLDLAPLIIVTNLASLRHAFHQFYQWIKKGAWPEFLRKIIQQ